MQKPTRAIAISAAAVLLAAGTGFALVIPAQAESPTPSNTAIEDGTNDGETADDGVEDGTADGEIADDASDSDDVQEEDGTTDGETDDDGIEDGTADGETADD